MINERTCADIVAEVFMSRTNFNGAYLLLEGDSDGLFFKRYCADDTKLEYVFCNGKKPAVDSIKELNNIGFLGAVAVVDDDFDKYSGVAPVANVIKTDTHDTETLLLRSVLSLFISQAANIDKVRYFEQQIGHSIERYIIYCASVLGKIRYLNDGPLQKNIAMEKSFSAPRYFDKNWYFDEDALILQYANELGVTSADLQTMMSAVPSIPAFNLIRGHDIVSIIAIGLKSAIGNNQFNERDLYLMLRLAFNDNDFKSTQLYVDLKNWEAASPPYQILNL
jgi:hypothetical protein